VKNFFILIKKELIMIFKKKYNILILYVIPFFAILLSYLISANASNYVTNIGVYDEDKTIISSGFIDFISETRNVRVIPVSSYDMVDLLNKEKIRCIVYFPKGFQSQLLTNKDTEIQIITQNSGNTENLLKSYANFYFKKMLQMINESQKTGYVQNKDKTIDIYNEYQKENVNLKIIEIQDKKRTKNSLNVSMGILIVFITLGSMSVSYNLISEKQNSILKRILTSPVSPLKYYAANISSNFLVLISQTLVVMFTITAVLRVNLINDIFGFWLMLAAYGIFSIAFSFFVVSVSPSKAYANSIFNIIYIPTCMIGGCFWEVSIMPGSLQGAAFFMPQQIFLKGLYFLVDYPDSSGFYSYFSILLLYSLVFFLIAFYSFENKSRV